MECPDLSWNDFKAAMTDAYMTLPCGFGKSDNCLKMKYHHLCKLTIVAAEKARNA